MNGIYREASQNDKQIIVEQLTSLSKQILQIGTTNTNSSYSFTPNPVPPFNPLMTNSLFAMPLSNSKPLISSGHMRPVNVIENTETSYIKPFHLFMKQQLAASMKNSETFAKVVNETDKCSLQQDRPKVAYNLITPLMPKQLCDALVCTNKLNSVVIQPFIAGFFRCLICCKSISGTQNVLEHANGKHHKSRLESPETNDLIVTYQNIWIKIGQHYQFHKYFTYPCINNSIFCELCNDRVCCDNINDLLKHIQLASHINNYEFIYKIKLMKEQRILSDITTTDIVGRHRTNSSTSVESSGSSFTNNSTTNVSTSNRRNIHNVVNSTDEPVNNFNLKKKSQQNKDSEIIKLMKEACSNPLKEQDWRIGSTPRDVSQSSSSSSVSTDISEKFVHDRLQLLGNIVISNSVMLGDANCKLKLLFSEQEIQQMSKEIKLFALNEINKKTRERSLGIDFVNKANSSCVELSNLKIDEVSEDKMEQIPSKPIINPDVWRDVHERDMINQAYIRATEGNKMQCTLCGIVISRNTSVLKEHIKGKNHQIRLHYKKKLRYFCETCDFFCDNLEFFNRHLNEKDHLNICTKEVTLKEHVCNECQTMIYSPNTSLENHKHFKLPKLVTAVTKRTKIDNIPERARLLLCNSVQLSDIAERLTNIALKVMNENSRDLDVCRLLELTLAKDFPGCKAYPFGSRVSGLGNSDSDLDVYLDTGNMYNGDKCQDHDSQARFVTTTYKALKRDSRWDGLESITNARTPIVRVYNMTHNIDCDISFRHGLSVENTKLLRLLLQMQPLARNLICLLKLWSQDTNLNKRLSSYALSFMAIFFLQVKGYLPAVWELMQNHNKTVIGNWECQLTNPRNFTVKPLNMQLTTLTKEFFNYYAYEFNYHQQVVCPLMGFAINKDLFFNPEKLPEQMKQYKLHFQNYPKELRNDPRSWISKYVVDHPSKDMFRYESALCVQDPFDLSHNLTKALPDREIEKFRKYCVSSFQVCGIFPGNKK